MARPAWLVLPAMAAALGFLAWSRSRVEPVVAASTGATARAEPHVERKSDAPPSAPVVASIDAAAPAAAELPAPTSRAAAPLAPTAPTAPALPGSGQAVSDATARASQASRPQATSATDPSPAATGTGEPSGASQGGFGTRASPPEAPSGAATPARTWLLRPEELKVTVGTDAVDITAPGPFHAGSDVPVLFVGDRSFRSSMYTAPNIIRFSGTGAVSASDRIALAYGNGAPMVLRRGVP